MAYRPIADYAIIGNTQSAALISSEASLDWLCWPRFDSPAMFLRILDDRRGGYCAVHATNMRRVARCYLDSTNILETKFAGPSGSLTVTDFMPVKALERSKGKGQDADAAHAIIRLLRCTAGEVECGVEIKPTFDFARQQTKPIRRESGRAVFLGRHESLHCQLPNISIDVGAKAHGTVRLRAGESCPIVLAWTPPNDDFGPVPAKQAEALFQDTRQYWRRWLKSCRYEGPHQDLVWRSALALKLLIYEPTGAIVAAPTTSLPEAIGGSRNWDYRYSWLRDASLTLVALMNLGYFGEAHDFFHFLHRSLPQDAAKFQIMYRVDGETEVPEQELEELAGYRLSRPVRIGNGAVHQTQLDIFGELLHCVYLYWSHHGFEHRGESFQRDFWPLVRSTANYVAQYWTRPGNGIWEMRGPKRQFTHAKAMCWVALDRAIKLAHRHGLADHVSGWEQAKRNIRRSLENQAFNKHTGAYTQSYHSTAQDASLLRLPLMGVFDPSSPRMRATVDAIERRLMRNGVIYRYSQDESNDGLQGHEGAFTACTFWLVENYVLQGRLQEADKLFRHAISFANDLGLMAEELDPESGEQLGNFPQGFTHIALISAAMRLAAAHRGEEPAVRLEGETGVESAA